MSAFLSALADYRYFKERGYPHKSVLKIIGDHHKLTKVQRNCLFRGVVATEEYVKTQAKTTGAQGLASKILGIDWFNVMITIESYLKGFPLFVSDDRIIRDSAGVHGSYRKTQVTDRAIGEILEAVDTLALSKVEIFLDSPISHSGEIAQALRESAGEALNVDFDISVVKSADFFLKRFEGVVASSDTIIIEHASSIFDLAGYVLSSRFGFTPPSLDLIFE